MWSCQPLQNVYYNVPFIAIHILGQYKSKQKRNRIKKVKGKTNKNKYERNIKRRKKPLIKYKKKKNKHEDQNKGRLKIC